MASENSAAAKAGLVLTRFVVPAWVLTGALFKLIEHTPRLLPPETVLYLAKKVEVDLYWLLATLIAIEFVAVAIMLFVGRLARPTAILMLGVFCLVMIGEMVKGNVTQCGCLGAASPPPWLMLGIDATLLAAVIILKPPTAPAPPPRRWPVPAAVVAGLAGVIASFAVVIPAGRVVPPPPRENGGDTQTDPQVNPNPRRPAQGWWATPADVTSWVGTPWREIDLFQFMDRWPQGMDGPKRYVVLYSRTCDHCEEMFNFDLTDESLASQVTAIEVPDSKTRLRGRGAWPMPPTACETMTLPLGYDWIMTTPVAVRLENGVVTCAQEGSHARCLELE